MNSKYEKIQFFLHLDPVKNYSRSYERETWNSECHRLLKGQRAARRSFVRNHAVLVESKSLRTASILLPYIALQILCSDWTRFNSENGELYPGDGMRSALPDNKFAYDVASQRYSTVRSCSVNYFR